MTNVLKSNNGKKLILFIHGFTGSTETWKNDNNEHFAHLLDQVPEIKAQYDIAEFIYKTSLAEMFTKVKIGARFLGFGKKEVIKFNLNIEETSELLCSKVRASYNEYDQIIIIAHSMGGLIAKSYILKCLLNESDHKCPLFLSLAVPHKGVNAATLLKHLGHPQGTDLSPLSHFINNTLIKWNHTDSDLLPKTVCYYGVYDDVVDSISALPEDMKNAIIIPKVDEDHFSISKPSDSTEDIFKLCAREIVTYTKTSEERKTLFQFLEDKTAYNNEDFVLKMVIADIHYRVINDAKKLFFDADYVLHQYRDDDTKSAKLSELSRKIEDIYSHAYAHFLTGKIPDSLKLLTTVYDEIKKEDRARLLAQNLQIDTLHKKGLLHHLANTKNRDVWWSDGHSELDLEALRKGNSDASS